MGSVACKWNYMTAAPEAGIKTQADSHVIERGRERSVRKERVICRAFMGPATLCDRNGMGHFLGMVGTVNWSGYWKSR